MDACLACWLDLEPDDLPRSRYAVEMLLAPLGIRPVFVPERPEAGPFLYYGPGPVAGRSIVSIRTRPDTPAFFRERRRLAAAPAGRLLWEDDPWPVFFGAEVRVDGGEPEADGDPVASAFCWLSGWDEWTRAERDRHGRAPFAGSAADRLGVIDRPCVDGYREVLAAWLRRIGVTVRRTSWNGGSWAVCPTHDVDYLRKWSRGLLFREAVRILPGGSRPASGRNRLGRLLSVARNLAFEPDPYRRSFRRMLALEREAGAGATYFVKTAARTPYDARMRTTSRAFREQIRALNEAGMEIGLHPGYFASDDLAACAAQKERLERIAGTDVVSVRNHYLRWHPVATPRLLDAAGVRIDASLGYAEREGFRRGTGHPFRLYDLAADRPLDVWEMPLLVMDSTLFHYRGMGSEEALDATRGLLRQVRRFGGAAVLLWHPILYDSFDHSGWHLHFERTLGLAGEFGGVALSLRNALACRPDAAPESHPTPHRHG